MRPIAVLLVVLVAIGALISALLFMGEETTPTIEPNLGGDREQTSATADRTPNLTDTQGRETPERVERDSNERVGLTQTGSPSHFDNQLLGSVIDRSGEPIAGAEVTLDFQSSELIYEIDREDRKPGRKATTNAKGKFNLRDIRPSDYYTLYVTHADFCPTKSTGVQVGQRDEYTEPPIVMQKGSPLSGSVTDTSGAPIAGAELALDVNMFSQLPGPLRQTAITDGSGFYSFDHVASGMLTLIVMADGFGTQAHGGMTFNGRDPITQDLELEIAAIIAGKVTDAETGKPIEGAQLLALNYSNSNRSSRDFTVSAEDGSFSLARLSAGDYTVMINAFGYNTDRILRVQTGELNIEIKLQGKAQASGTVIAGDTGAPVASGVLQLRTVHNGTDFTSPMDVAGTFENGQFTLSNVPAGEYLIEASAIALGYSATYSSPFTVADGQNVNGIVIRLKRGAKITGRVTDESGRAVGGALVSTHDNNYTSSDQEFYQLFGDSFQNNATSQEVRTGTDGIFSFEAMRPDVYQINIEANGYVRYIQRNIQLRDQEERDLKDLQLSQGGTVRGTLYDAGGVPLPGGQVHMRLADQGEVPERYDSKSDATGSYLIENIRPGTYSISATSSTLGGNNPFEDIANRKATESTIVVNEGRTLNHDLHLTGQPDSSTPTGNDPRQR